MHYLLVGFVAVLGLVWLAVRAFRDEYLMMLHWPASGALFFERSEGGRYARVPVFVLPLAALRYGIHVAAPRAARRRAPEPRVARTAPAALAHR